MVNGMSEYPITEKTRIRRLPKRGNYDRSVVNDIIDKSLLCHVGVSIDGQPRVIPTAILRIDDYVYLHGSVNSQLLMSLIEGAPACITVSIIDSLVASRSGFNCAVDYRSVVIFSSGEEITQSGEKNRILERFIQHMIPGHKVRPAKPKELNATAILRFPLTEASAKIRNSGVGDFEEDLDLDLWAGVIPLRIAAGSPKPCPHLKAGIETPKYALEFRGWEYVDSDTSA